MIIRICGWMTEGNRAAACAKATDVASVLGLKAN
jgi:hypothetical protein